MGDRRDLAIRKGLQDRLDGEPVTANPYTIDADEHRWWRDGWQYADDRLPDDTDRQLEGSA